MQNDSTINLWQPSCLNKSTKRPARRIRSRPTLENLESRIALSIGGGWISSTQQGQTGEGAFAQYFNNSSLEGDASFTRWDARVDWFTGSGSIGLNGGNTEPDHQSDLSANWSARWTGTVTANFSETYTFHLNTSGRVRLWVTPEDQQAGAPSITDWSTHSQALDTQSIALLAGHNYQVTLEYAAPAAAVQQVQLQWSSPSTPLEDIDNATQAGVNVTGGDSLFANMVNGGSRTTWWAADNNNVTVPTDSNFWPMTDSQVYLGEGDITTQLGGTYLVQFKGMATVTVSPGKATWSVNGVDLRSSTLQAGQGYDPLTNTTVALMTVSASTTAGLRVTFTNTSREANAGLNISSISEYGNSVTVTTNSVAGLAINQKVTLSGFNGNANQYNGTFTITGINAATKSFTVSNPIANLPAVTGAGNALVNPRNGITGLYVMRPSSPGGNNPLSVGTLFNPTALSMFAQYSVLRLMDLNSTNGNLTSDWTDRTLVSYNFWSAYTANSKTGVNTGVTASGQRGGVPWEIQIALANTTGKDIYINIPSNVSTDYITQLANLFAFGSDGINAYSSPQDHPIWSPLDSNLKVYIEFSNETWNSGFTQAASRSDGWANQLSQRALYDYFSGNHSDPLYPGGGSNAYNDGAVLAGYYNFNSNDIQSFLNTYNASPGQAYGSASPAYFSNAASSIKGYSTGQAWIGLRATQISNAFKASFGETSVAAVRSDSRVRPLIEWMSGGGWSSALAFIEAVYGKQQPVSYFLYGGGGGWYADNKVGGFSDVSFANSSFANGLTGWSANGSAGIVANGSEMGNPDAPPGFAAITLGNGASESGLAVTITTTTPHNFSVGQTVNVSGVPVSGYNGTFTVTASTAYTFTYTASVSGLLNSGGGIVTGTSKSPQAAYLKPGASISQTVTFSGGYADITLYATQNVPASSTRGLTITLTPTNGGPAINGGNPIRVSEGASSLFFSGSLNAYVWGRSEAFFTGVGQYAYNIVFTNTLTDGTVYLAGVAIQTVNGMFNETTASLRSTQLDISKSVQADIGIATQYGIFAVGYEGGFDFSQNLSGYYDINGYRDMGSRGYSSGVPNVGMFANADPRALNLAIDAFSQFYASGGTLAVVYQSSGNINSWGIAAPTYFDWNTPKQQAVSYIESKANSSTYGASAGQAITSPMWWLNTAKAGSVQAVYIVQQGKYAVTVTFSANPGAPTGEFDPVDLIVDGKVAGTLKVSTKTGGTYTIDVGVLTAGQHSVKIVNTASTTSNNLFLGKPGTPIFSLDLVSPAVYSAPILQPKIFWNDLTSIMYGSSMNYSELNAVSNVPGTFLYTGVVEAGTVAGDYTVYATFTPSDQQNYATVTIARTLSVAKATPTIEWSGLTSVYNNTASVVTAYLRGTLGAAGVSRSTSLDGVSPNLTFFAGSSANGPALLSAPSTVGVYTAVAFFPGSQNYAFATASAVVVIKQASPIVTWIDPGNVAYGTSLMQLSANAFSSVSGVFVCSLATGASLCVGVNQQIVVTFYPNDTTNYSVVELSESVNVIKAIPKFSAAAFNIVYDGSPHSLSYNLSGVNGEDLTALANVYYNGSALAPVLPGQYRVSAVFPGTDNYEAVDDESIVVTISKPAVVAPPPPSEAQSIPGLKDVQFTVQHGAIQRSFVQFLDVKFNLGGDALKAIVDSICVDPNDLSPAFHRMRLFRYDLNGSAGSRSEVSLQQLLSINGNQIEINFGSKGIAGASSSNASDGYYELQMDLGNGVTSVHSFYRLLGDVNGDGKVDNSDVTLVSASMNQVLVNNLAVLASDVDGDGKVSAVDLVLVTKQKGLARKLASWLLLG